MRVTALVLGVVGGVIGLSCGTLSVQAGAQLAALGRLMGSDVMDNTFGGRQMISAGALVVLVSLLAVVGGGLALGRPRTAALLMFLAAVVGVTLVRADYLLAAGLLFAGGLLALLSPRPIVSAPSAGAATTSALAVTAMAPSPLGSSPDVHAPSTAGASAPSVAVWGIGIVLMLMTWWFWVFALFGVLGLAAVAWIPRLGPSVLAWAGWSRLPVVGGIRGWKASGTLLVLAITVLLVGTYIAPRAAGP